MSDDALDGLIQRADLDALVRLVDDRTAAGDWDGLRTARDRAVMTPQLMPDRSV